MGGGDQIGSFGLRHVGDPSVMTGVRQTLCCTWWPLLNNGFDLIHARSAPVPSLYSQLFLWCQSSIRFIAVANRFRITKNIWTPLIEQIGDMAAVPWSPSSAFGSPRVGLDDSETKETLGWAGSLSAPELFASGVHSRIRTPNTSFLTWRYYPSMTFTFSPLGIMETGWETYIVLCI